MRCAMVLWNGGSLGAKNLWPLAGKEEKSRDRPLVMSHRQGLFVYPCMIYIESTVTVGLRLKHEKRVSQSSVSEAPWGQGRQRLSRLCA